jgi:hypothetical protein
MDSGVIAHDGVSVGCPIRIFLDRWIYARQFWSVFEGFCDRFSRCMRGHDFFGICSVAVDSGSGIVWRTNK